jgi:hypothetical protein
MLMSELITAVLPRVARTEAPATGITIFGAANSIQSLIYKNLVNNKSDLQVTGDLDLQVPAFGYKATLPTGFIAPAEKPMTEELVDDWMAGTVVSYNNTTGALVVNVTQSSGTDNLSYWDIALGAYPGQPATNIGNSISSLTCGTGAKSLTTQLGLNLSVGQYLILSSENSPAGWVGRRHVLQPRYLDDDDEDYDERWWNWYGFYGVWDTPYVRPHKYKIIGTTIYIRPKPIVDIKVIGKYYAIPQSLALTSDTIPWGGLFDQIFIEGVVRIIQKGISNPQADPDFMVFFITEYNSVVYARQRIIPSTRRIHRGNWL